MNPETLSNVLDALFLFAYCLVILVIVVGVVVIALCLAVSTVANATQYVFGWGEPGRFKHELQARKRLAELERLERSIREKEALLGMDPTRPDPTDQALVYYVREYSRRKKARLEEHGQQSGGV